MKTKFGLAALDAIQQNYKIILERLIKGYEKVTGKKPEGLDLTMIKREAYEKAEDSAKVVDMEGKTLDPSKPIMGGKQMIEEDIVVSKGPRPFGDNIRDAYKGAGRSREEASEMIEALDSPGAKKSYEIMEESLGVRLYGDETFEELMKIKETGVHPRGEPPIKKADGGRINFRLGGPTNIIGAGLTNPGLLGAGMPMEEEDEFADIQGQTAGIGLFGAVSKGIQSIFGPKLGAAIFENYVRRPSINKGMDAIKKANDIAYAKRLELEEKLATRAALARAQEEINRMGYQDYGSGGASAETMASYEGPDGSYAGASTQDYGSGEKDGGLITMFVEKR